MRKFFALYRLKNILPKHKIYFSSVTNKSFLIFYSEKRREKNKCLERWMSCEYIKTP